MENKFIKAIEVFSTFQGEGLFSGKRVILIRFKKCNNDCYFCDTMNKMRYFEEGNYDIKDIQKLLSNECANLLITGGEPSFDVNFDRTILLLNELKYPEAYVETNGYKLKELYKYIQNKKNVYYVYSPKFFNQIDLFNDKTDELVKLIGRNLIIKVLYDGENPFNKRYLDKIIKYRESVYLQPIGSTREEVSRNMPSVIEVADEYKFNVTTRMHIIEGFR